MQIKVNREEFLHLLEATQPGLARDDKNTEQGSCYVFQRGSIKTFNDEVSCKVPGPFPKDFAGAVKGEKLLAVLAKRTEEELEVSDGDGKLSFSGRKGRSISRFALEAEILLPVGSVEKPEGWKPLHEDFCEAVGIVGSCCSDKADAQFETVCVHLHPKWVEASDRFQICRWPLKTGLGKATLVRQSAIKHVATLGMTEFAETGSWLHFKNAAGLVLSCRRYLEDFPDLGQWLDVEGTSVSLPKGLEAALGLADEFSSENIDNNRVFVRIKSGRIWVEGVGLSGSHEHRLPIKWGGAPLEFLIAPQMLADIVKRHSTCEVAPGRLKAEVKDSYTYVACLSRPQGNGEAEAEPEEPTTSEEPG